MKQIAIAFMATLLLVGCSKNDTKPTDELKTLTGTEWTGTIDGIVK